MKKVKEFFEYYDFEMAFVSFGLLSALALLLLGMILSLVYSNAAWLWLWALAIVFASFTAGKMD